MNEKRDLAKLFTVLDLPVAEFVKSEPFKKLEQEPELINYLEPFGLPEVKRLICCSSVLATQEWAAKYSDARKLYADDYVLDAAALLNRYEDAEVFENKILKCIDGSILNQIALAIEKLEQEVGQAKKERSSRKGKTAKAKKKLATASAQKDDVGQNDAAEKTVEEQTVGSEVADTSKSETGKAANVVSLEKQDGQPAAKEFSLTNYAQHIDKVKLYRDKINDIEKIDEQRQKAYDSLAGFRPSLEKQFLEHYIKDGTLLPKDKNALQNFDFLRGVIKLLDKPDQRYLAFPVLAKLYTDKAIDLGSDLVAEFTGTHSSMLSEHLEAQYSSDPSYLEKAESRVFLGYAIKGTIAGNTDHARWWNRIGKATDWKTILETAKVITNMPLLQVATKLLHRVHGIAMTAFMDLLQSEQAGTFKITLSEFIIEHIEREAPEQREFIKDYVHRTDQTFLKLKRSLANSERLVKRHGQELFSALYQPLDQLERLAINLRRSEGEIRCSLVANQLINELAELRAGLSELGLNSVADIGAWKEQNFVDYDPQKYRLLSPIRAAEKQVKLQTLGFAYTDEEGKDKVRAAEVYITSPPRTKAKKGPVQNKQKQPATSSVSKESKGSLENRSAARKQQKDQREKGEKK